MWLPLPRLEFVIPKGLQKYLDDMLADISATTPAPHILRDDRGNPVQLFTWEDGTCLSRLGLASGTGICIVQVAGHGICAVEHLLLEYTQTLSVI